MNVTPMLGLAEPLASLSHLAGAFVALALGPTLVRSGRSFAAKAALGLFVTAVVTLLLISGGYHLIHPGETSRATMQQLDHAAIWALIAATFTPIHAIAFKGAMRWGMLLVIWSIALVGIVLKTAYFSLVPESVGLAMYLGMGWLGAISIVGLARANGVRAALPLVYGGLFYTVGAVVSLAAPAGIISEMFGRHEFFHLAVLGGIAMHWRFLGSLIERLESRLPVLSPASS